MIFVFFQFQENKSIPRKAFEQVREKKAPPLSSFSRVTGFVGNNAFDAVETFKERQN